MKMIKVKFPHYWIELPADLELIELAKALKTGGLKLIWSVKNRRLEVTKK